MKRVNSMVCVGIDFGTTNSTAAVHKNGLLNIVTTSAGKRIIPSLVSFTREGEIFIGDEARTQAATGKAITIFSIKKQLGTAEKYRIFQKLYTPIEITSYILKYVKEQIEHYLGESIHEVVISSPAYFSINQRMALAEACSLAHLKVKEIINEPNAAALSYGLEDLKEQNILVYDLGGGTCDISVIHSSRDRFQVLAIAGDNNLGGDNFDLEIINLMVKSVRKQFKVDLLEDPIWVFQVKQVAEKAKIKLSQEGSVLLRLNLPGLDRIKDFIFELTRSTLEGLIRPYVERSLTLINQAMIHAQLSPDQVGQVLLVGGSTRIPLVRESISSYFKNNIYLGMNADECVARGAALHCHHLEEKKDAVVLKDVIPLSLGLEVQGGIFVPMIKKNSAMPVSCTKIFTPISRRQKNIEIKIFQGERIRARDNIYLGRLILKNVQNKKSHELARIEVRFIVDENGLIILQARDLITSKTTEISLTPIYQAPSARTRRIIEKARLVEVKDLQSLFERQVKDKARALLLRFREKKQKEPVAAARLEGLMNKIKGLLRMKDYQTLNDLLKLQLEEELFRK